MAVDQVAICNLALIKVGSFRISSIDEDTKPAILLKAIYEQKRDTMLRAHRWNFATKRSTLAPNATTPDFGFDYQYDLPSDCLRVLEPDSEEIDFLIEGDRQLLCDETTLNLVYIYRNTDETSWDSLFQEAFASSLAADVCYALTQSAALADLRIKEAAAKLADARSIDGAEGSTRQIEIVTWTNARR
jgi:hypothetical protein